MLHRLMHPQRLLLLVGACACAGSVLPETASSPGQATVVVGFLDAGYPYPSGEGDPGVPIAAGPDNGRRCDPVVAQGFSDSTGQFRLRLPAQVAGGWVLCMPIIPSSPPGYPMFLYEGRGLDSLRVYCRGHGPGGRPECRYVPWTDPFRWPGGEAYDSVPVPPN